VLPGLKEVKRIFTLEKVSQGRQAIFCVVVLTAFNGATSEVDIATLYRLHGPGIESRWVGPKILRTRPNRLWGPSSLLFKGHRVLFGSKATGCDVDHPPHLTSRLKNEYSNISTASLVLLGRS
jgi:hypothetical protein